MIPDSIGQYSIKNHSVVLSKSFTWNETTTINCVYEVVRIDRGIPLFVEDHFERFINSISLLKSNYVVSLQDFNSDIQSLIKHDCIDIGNVRIDLLIDVKPILLVYQVKHEYPTTHQYKNGVALENYQVERRDPHIKQNSVNSAIRNQIQELLNNPNVYEVLLLNHLSQVTEGSRSNIFFIRNNVLHSPPDKDVLKGITRKRVLKLTNELGIIVKNTIINFSSIEQFDAAFITGTSPKILPISKINTLNFDPNHLVIRNLMKAYDEDIRAYQDSY